MAEQWCNTVLSAYSDKVCFVALQRYGVIKSAILSGQKQTAANIQPIADGSIKMIQQQFLQRNLFINAESFRVDRLEASYLVLTNFANKFIQRVLVLSDPALQQIAVLGANSFQSERGLLEVGDVLSEMFRMQARLARRAGRQPQPPRDGQAQQRLTSFMEYDFAHPEVFVFKFKCFEKLDLSRRDEDARQAPGASLDADQTELAVEQLAGLAPTDPLDARLTLFALVDGDSPRRLQTAFELYELQAAAPELAVVLCLRGVQRGQLRRLAADAPFLRGMNVVLDLGNAEGFLKNNEAAFYTYAEDDEQIFARLPEAVDYVRLRLEGLEPAAAEERAAYARGEEQTRVLVNGVACPLVNEGEAAYADQRKFLVFYFNDTADNLSYLVSELLALQHSNADCFVVAALSPRQYAEYYYLRQIQPDLARLATVVDNQNAGFYLIGPGHTHVCYYVDHDAPAAALEQLDELLAREDVRLERGEAAAAQPDLVDGEEEVRFKGVRFQKVRYERVDEGDEVQPDPADNPRRRVQGRTAVCLLRDCFDYDQQLYKFYALSARVRMDFVVCFAGAVDAEIKAAFDRMSVLNELILWKDVTQRGAAILQKADTLIRFYLVNGNAQVYDSADDVDVLDQLLQAEFQSQYVAHARNAAKLSMASPEHMVYEGRAYRYLNNHQQFDPETTHHVTVFFTFLPPVSRVVNYDAFKRQLARMAEVERNYKCNMNVLCVVGLSEEQVRQINELTNMLKKTQVVVDNNTVVAHTYERLGRPRGKYDEFVAECHSFEPDQDPVAHAFDRFEDLELFLHDQDMDPAEGMPEAAGPQRRRE